MKKKRSLIIAIGLFAIAGQSFAATSAVQSPISGFFDNAFFGALNFLYKNLTMYSATALQLAKLLFLVDALILLIFIAFGLKEIYKELVSKLLTLGVVLAALASWSYLFIMTTQLTLSVANIPVNQTIGEADTTMRAQMEEIYRKYMLAKAQGTPVYSDDKGTTIKTGAKSQADVLEEQYQTLSKSLSKLQIWASGNIYISAQSKSYTVNLNQYLRPEAILQYTMALMTPLWAQTQSVGLDIGRALMMWSTILICYILGALISIQYIMAMLEWAILGLVGLLLVPTALLDATKFISEKLIATIAGHIIKIIVVYLVVGIVTGLMFKLTTATYRGTQDQIFQLLFNYILFFILTSQIPGLAQSLMGGGPSLSGSSLAQVGRSVMSGIANGAQAARMGQKAAQTAGRVTGTGYHMAHSAVGALGAAVGKMRDAPEGQGGTAFAQSLGGSVVNTLRSGVNQAQVGALKSSYLAPKGYGGGGGGGGGGGVQDQGDANYQGSLNKESTFNQQLQNAGMTSYFNARGGKEPSKEEDKKTESAPPPAGATSAEKVASQAQQAQSAGYGSVDPSWD